MTGGHREQEWSQSNLNSTLVYFKCILQMYTSNASISCYPTVQLFNFQLYIWHHFIYGITFLKALINCYQSTLLCCLLDSIEMHKSNSLCPTLTSKHLKGRFCPLVSQSITLFESEMERGKDDLIWAPRALKGLTDECREEPSI